MPIDASTLPELIANTTKKFLSAQFDIKLNNSDIRATVQDDVAFVRLKGLVSMAEKEFSKNPKGEELVRNMYHKLFDKSSLLLENMLKNSTGMEVRNINVEIEPELMELILVIHFTENITQIDKTI